MSQDDRELVQRVLVLNDRNAYCDLVRKYQVEVRSYLVRLTHNGEWACDIAQETFLTGYRRLDQLKDFGKFRAWIYSVAHTQFLQWHRSHENFDSDEAIDVAIAGDAFAGSELRMLFKSLRPEECSVLTLCLAHEFSHGEAAQMLNLPIGTVKSLILRARAKLGVKNE